MPAYYTDVPGATQTTNAAANTANDCFFVAPGTTARVAVRGILPAGRGAAKTNVSGISYRLEKWTSTASSGGSSITPSPDAPEYRAAKHTAGFSASTVVSGTGGPTLMTSVGSGIATPGQWLALPSLDDAYWLDAAATQSLDIFNVTGDVSLVFELSVLTAE